MHKKCQIAIEFTVLFALTLILAIVLVAVSFSQKSDLSNMQKYEQVKDIGDQIKSEISITSYAANGYLRQFTLPEKVGTEDYEITIVNNTLTVWTETTAYATLILNITGEIKKGVNTVNVTGGGAFIN